MVEIQGLGLTEAKEYLFSETPRQILEMFNLPYEVSREQISFYRENGFVKLEGVLGGEALEYARK